jgi:hypothetical protein
MGHFQINHHLKTSGQFDAEKSGQIHRNFQLGTNSI